MTFDRGDMTSEGSASSLVRLGVTIIEICCQRDLRINDDIEFAIEVEHDIGAHTLVVITDDRIALLISQHELTFEMNALSEALRLEELSEESFTPTALHLSAATESLGETVGADTSCLALLHHHLDVLGEFATQFGMLVGIILHGLAHLCDFLVEWAEDIGNIFGACLLELLLSTFEHIGSSSLHFGTHT